MNWNIITQYLIVQGNENIIVDLGAQVGTYSEFLWKTYGGRCKKLISVEPHPDNCKKIRERIANNNAGDKWVVDECAVDIHEGISDLQFLRTPSDEPLGSFILDDLFPPLKKEDYLDKIEHIGVRMKTMKQICDAPTIIKIDIEGMEYAILPELMRLPSVYALIIEFSNIPYPAWENQGYCLEDYLWWLDYKGFKNMMGHTESKDGEIIFYLSFPLSTSWKDLPAYPYNKCFHVLAQKNGRNMPGFKVKG